jgi:hypothetical protein
MQPPHTFIVMAGGSPVAALGLVEASRLIDYDRPAPAPRLRWSGRTLRAERPAAAASRRGRFATAARRLVSRPA